jgi:hypothetical protein
VVGVGSVELVAFRSLEEEYRVAVAAAPAAAEMPATMAKVVFDIVTRKRI